MSTTTQLNLDILQGIFPSKTVLPKAPTTAQSQQIQRSLEHLALGIHWTIKLDWDSKHKIPANRKTTAAIKPFGEYLHQTFLLCAAVHSRQATLPQKLPYSDAGEWFRLICQDKAVESILSILYPSDQGNEKTVVVHNGEIKRKLLRQLADNPRGIEKGINPVESNTVLINLSALIDASIYLSKESIDFKKNSLKPWLDSWKNTLAAMESPEWQRLFIEDDKLKQQRSGSKGSKTIN